MNTYPVICVLVAVVVAAITVGPFGIFVIWLSLKAGDWAQTLSRKFGELFSWMVYLPLCFIALSVSIALGAFIFSKTMVFLAS